MVRGDNQSSIRLSNNPVFHDQSKHIDIRSLLERLCSEGNHSVGVHTDREQVADIFTKALCRHSFVKFKDKLGLLQNPFLVERKC